MITMTDLCLLFVSKSSIINKNCKKKIYGGFSSENRLQKEVLGNWEEIMKSRQKKKGKVGTASAYLFLALVLISTAVVIFAVVRGVMVPIV